MRIVLVGSRGQLGWELQRSLAPLGELRCFDSRELDLRHADALRSRLRDEPFDVLVNAAAYTAVDRAETEVELAHAINATAPALLAEAAARRSAWLVHYGTDYVFDGSGHAPRDESTPTGPLSVYGASKLAGEEHIRASGCQHLILRTGWVYAARGENFARTMLRLAAERDALEVVADQVGAPTGAELLADVTAHVLRAAAGDSGVAGTYHVAAAGETSWHGYAQFVVATARALGAPLRATPQAIAPIPTSAWPTAAKRPLNSRLDTRKLRSTFGLALPAWQAGVERMLSEVVAALPPASR